MKIVFFGDSLTWGGYGGSYFDELKPLLPDHELINAGEGGNTAINLMRRLDDDVLSHAPDGVFVMIGGNDAISYSQPETRPYYKQVQKIPEGVVTPDQFSQAYRDLLTQLQLAHTLVWIGLPPAEYNPQVVEAMRMYNNLASEVARAFNIPVLDLMEAFPPENVQERPVLGMPYILTIGSRGKSGWSDYEKAQKEGGFTFTFDGLHVTPESAKKAAKIIADFIRS
jgi:lysophospholipase L1-like esterase